MALTHLQLLSWPVSDQDRSLAFFTDVLGFDLIRDNPMGPGMRWVQVGLPGAQTSITLVTWFETMPAGSAKGLVIETNDLDADYARLIAGGVEIPDGIQDEVWGRYVTFDDPDGNGIVVQTTSPTA